MGKMLWLDSALRSLHTIGSRKEYRIMTMRCPCTYHDAKNREPRRRKPKPRRRLVHLIGPDEFRGLIAKEGVGKGKLRVHINRFGHQVVELVYERDIYKSSSPTQIVVYCLEQERYVPGDGTYFN